MSNIAYRYSVGDTVKFKVRFHPSASCELKKLAGSTAKITGYAPAYNNRPHYHLNGVNSTAYPETCFSGLTTEPVNFLYRDGASQVDTEQGSETKCDT
jgi:hypothetical protein